MALLPPLEIVVHDVERLWRVAVLLGAGLSQRVVGRSPLGKQRD